MQEIKLSEHSFYKGKFISPMNDVNLTMTQMSWLQKRLPEYIVLFRPNKYE